MKLLKSNGLVRVRFGWGEIIVSRCFVYVRSGNQPLFALRFGVETKVWDDEIGGHITLWRPTLRLKWKRIP